MTDNAPELKMKLRGGQPIAAISASALQHLHDFVKYLTVRNGRLIRNGNRYTIECGASAGAGKWTGILWYGNDITDFSAMTGWPADVVDGKYLVVNLLDGTTSWTDDLGTLDDSNEQAFWVADEVSTGVYRLNNHTQGDIHARIT